MLTDPILDAWLTSADTATAHYPELATWLSDRETLIAAGDAIEGYQFDPGEVMIRAGAEERHAWVLSHGSAEVLHTDEAGQTSTVRLARAPTTLGAFGFAIGQPRAVTVRSLGSAIALRLGRAELAQVGARNPEVAIGLLRWLALDVIGWLQQTRGRTDPWSRTHGMIGAERSFAALPPGRHPLDAEAAAQARALLSGVRCFQGASPDVLIDGLGEQIHLVGVDAGAAITSDGDLDRSLLVLLEGAASVRNLEHEVLAGFSAGSDRADQRLIGELGFLTTIGRDGTVVADSDCLLLEIPHASAPWIAANHPDFAFKLHVALLRTVCWRLREQDVDRDRTASILSGDLDAWLAD